MAASTAAAQQQQRQHHQHVHAFKQLLDPTDLLPGHNVADLYSLRHLCLRGGGIPDDAGPSTSRSTLGTSVPASSASISRDNDSGWLRAQAWRVLLGYLSPEKAEWSRTLDKRRAEYYQYVEDFLPKSDEGSGGVEGHPNHAASGAHPGGKLSERDALVDQIYRDLSRSRKNAFAFYRQDVRPSWSCPLAPEPIPSTTSTATKRKAMPRSKRRHGLLQRLESFNDDYAQTMQAERQRKSRPGNAAHTPLSGVLQGAKSSASHPSTPTITLNAAHSSSEEAFLTPNSDIDDRKPESTSDATTGSYFPEAYIDQRWHSLLRILYIYALLNPSMGYVQGMNEVLFVLLYVMGTSAPPPTTAVPGNEQQATPSMGMPTGSTSADEIFARAEDASSSLTFTDHHDEPSGSHAEADAFWCFSALIGEVRDLYDFDNLDYSSVGLRVSHDRAKDLPGSAQTGVGTSCEDGMAGALRRFSLRLSWLDEELWRSLRLHSLDPVLPYYSFRWLACLISTELSLPSLVRVWDALLSEPNEARGEDGIAFAPKVEFLIDICCALIGAIRDPLLEALQESSISPFKDDGEFDAFSRAMDILQTYPDGDIGPVLEMAFLYRQKRLATPLTGDGPPTDFKEEDVMSNIRSRTMNAFRGWKATGSPAEARKGPWLISTPNKPPNAGMTAESGSTSTPTPTRLQRYAEAFQSSDAAATLSKTSSNWHAKAMATWNGTDSATSTPSKSTSGSLLRDVEHAVQPRKTSLAELGSSWFARSAAVGDTSSPASATLSARKDIHPALRWSRQGVPPDLPLPVVGDSPPGREEYHGPSRLFQGRAGPKSVAGSQQSASSSPDATVDHEEASAGTPSRFAHLPSLANAHAKTKPPAMSRVASGPKPLLLQRSAGPPRESPTNGKLATEEPASRKISTGPLAAAALNAVTAMQSPSGIGSSSNGSESASSSVSGRKANGSANYRRALADGAFESPLSSWRSSTDTDSAWRAGASRGNNETSSSNDGHARMSQKDPGLQASPPPPVPSKETDSSAKSASDQTVSPSIAQMFEGLDAFTTPPLSGNEENLADQQAPIAADRMRSKTLLASTTPLHRGTAPAAAFGRAGSATSIGPNTSGSTVTAPSPPTDEAYGGIAFTGDERPLPASQAAEKPNAFGIVTSSSDVPLTQKSSLQRKPRRKASDSMSTTTTTTGAVSPEGDSTSGSGSVSGSGSRRGLRRGSKNVSVGSIDETGAVFASTAPRRTSRRNNTSDQI